MNRRGFFKGLLSAALTAAAHAYVPSALQGTPRYVDKFEWDWPPPPKSLGEQMREAMLSIGHHDGVKYFYASPETIAMLKELAARKPNRWQRRQRRLEKAR